MDIGAKEESTPYSKKECRWLTVAGLASSKHLISKLRRQCKWRTSEFRCDTADVVEVMLGSKSKILAQTKLP